MIDWGRIHNSVNKKPPILYLSNKKPKVNPMKKLRTPINKMITGAPKITSPAIQIKIEYWKFCLNDFQKIDILLMGSYV
jgi:hypothetical protein